MRWKLTKDDVTGGVKFYECTGNAGTYRFVEANTGYTSVNRLDNQFPDSGGFDNIWLASNINKDEAMVFAKACDEYLTKHHGGSAHGARQGDKHHACSAFTGCMAIRSVRTAEVCPGCGYNGESWGDQLYKVIAAMAAGEVCPDW